MNSIIKLTRLEFQQLSAIKTVLKTGIDADKTQLFQAISNLLKAINHLSFSPLISLLSSDVSLKEVVTTFEVFEDNVEVAR